MGPSSPAVPRSVAVAPTVSAGKASVVVQGRSRRECWTALSGSSSAFRRTREVELLPQPGPHRVRLVVAPAGPRFQNAQTLVGRLRLRLLVVVGPGPLRMAYPC